MEAILNIRHKYAHADVTCEQGLNTQCDQILLCRSATVWEIFLCPSRLVQRCGALPTFRRLKCLHSLFIKITTMTETTPALFTKPPAP